MSERCQDWHQRPFRHLSMNRFTPALKQSTPRQGRAALIMPVYLTLQRMGRAACRITAATGGLLHHLFTIAGLWPAVIFCHATEPSPAPSR